MAPVSTALITVRRGHQVIHVQYRAVAEKYLFQQIPRELYEAAEIDGAGPVRRFFRVTLPMLSPVILFNLIMAVIGSFQVFTQAFVMTGGEPGDLTRFYVLYLYNKAFELYDMGYASAMAWILLLIVLVLTGIILRTSARVVYYESLRK
jgi:multiple sugar transport system permease protein